MNMAWLEEVTSIALIAKLWVSIRECQGTSCSVSCGPSNIRYGFFTISLYAIGIRMPKKYFNAFAKRLETLPEECYLSSALLAWASGCFLKRVN